MKDGELDREAENPEDIAFGMGRRACPGKHLAMASVWIAIASMLALFEIRNQLTRMGLFLNLHEDALLAMPLPFKCSFVPRFEGAEHMLEVEESWKFLSIDHVPVQVEVRRLLKIMFAPSCNNMESRHRHSVLRFSEDERQ